MARFGDDLRSIAAEPNITIVAVDDAAGRWVAERFDTPLLSKYTTTVSSADPHPDAQGHAVIAEQLGPIVATRPAHCAV
jgi:hypothetical protein